ncbi:MAG: hypothetical protein NC394_09575 [Bacteroides sp.]|nr:hypothetical protein [Bacteroides sp.]
MDYKNYRNLILQYRALDNADLTSDDIIGELTRISLEKKRIKNECNQIIDEYVKKYEADTALLNSEDEAVLRDFLKILIQPDVNDIPIAFRISKLLLKYYSSADDRGNIIQMLEYCTVFDIIIKEHLDDYAGSEYPRLAEKYMPQYLNLSERGRASLLNAVMLGVVNRKDMTQGFRKYKEIKKWLESMGLADDPSVYPDLVRCGENALGFLLEAIRQMTHSDISAVPIDLRQERPYIQEIVAELRKLLNSGNPGNILPDRIVAELYCAQADYHLGETDIEQLLAETKGCTVIKDDHSASEYCSAYFTANAYYIDYLHKDSKYPEAVIAQKCREIVDDVLKNAKNTEQYLGNYQTNYSVLLFIHSASSVVGFNAFKDTVLKATVYADKALHVHTMIVKEISLVIFDHIVRRDPRYFDSVAGHTWQEFKEQYDEACELMEKCALFHDIGKYFCLDYTSNSSRNLTDDEFEVIKNHPANFLKVYQGAVNTEVQCVYDCALLHHLWYDETNGYPYGYRHTCNKPYVNIISVADSIDAATDNIGRPYGNGKNLDDMIKEFEHMKNTRYSGYVCDILKIPEVKEKIEYILDAKRKEIYRSIYREQ